MFQACLNANMALQRKLALQLKYGSRAAQNETQAAALALLADCQFFPELTHCQPKDSYY